MSDADPPSRRSEHPAVRHLYILVATVLASVFIAATHGAMVTAPMLVGVGIALVCAVQIVAMLVPWPRMDPQWTVAVPAASMMAAALIRAGTGGSASVFTSLMLLPLVWIAVAPGTRAVVLAAVTSLITLGLPFLIGTEQWTSGQLVRVGFGGMIFTGVALIVHDIARHSRRRLDEVTALSDERETLLERAREDARHLAETAVALRESEAFADSIWAAIDSEGVIVTDLQGRIISWGPGTQTLLGHTPAEMMDGGHWFTDLVWHEPDEQVDRAAVLQRLIAVGSAPARGDGDFLMRHQDGTPVPSFLTCARRRDLAGTELGYIFVIRDGRYAQEVSRLKDEFVGTVSHELRTPLSSILGYLELVAEEEENLSDDQKRFLQVAERNAQRLLHLVGDLLFIAQTEAGAVPLEPVPVDLREIADASAESVRPAASRARVSAVWDAPSEPVLVQIDPRRIGQAIDNLLSNAVKFTPPEGTVTLSVGVEDDDAVIRVADTGMGIPPEDLAQLSERFFRSRMASRQGIQGVGLGLSITKAIVTTHGGTLSASSTVGEGTVFEIRLPRGAE